jgi:hypothetical protein
MRQSGGVDNTTQGRLWLMLTLRDAIPKPQLLATAEFATLRMRLIKTAAGVTETPTQVRIAFAAACPDATQFQGTARSLQRAGPRTCHAQQTRFWEWEPRYV